MKLQVSGFSLDQCQLMGYVHHFYVRNVSRVGVFVLGDELIRELYNQKKINVKVVPPN